MKHNPPALASSKHIIISIFIIALLAATSMGCNTARGFGKDVERAGEKIQDGTR